MPSWPEDDNTITREELTKELAEIEGIDVDELERQAAEFEIAPPWEAEVVEVSGSDD